MTVVTTSQGTFQTYAFEPTVPLEESLTWLTDVFEARTGLEYPTQVRERPRHNYRFTYPIPSEEVAQSFNALANNFPWLVPIWTEAQKCTDVFTVNGKHVIMVPTDNVDLRGHCLLWSNKSTFHVREILDNSTPGAIEVDISGVQVGWYVIPMRIGRLIERTKTTNGYSASMTLEWEIEDSLLLEPGASPLQFEFFDTYFEPPYSRELTKSIQILVDRFDGKTGLVAYKQPWTQGRFHMEYRNVLRNLAEVRNHKNFLYRRRGRAWWFYAPTHEWDLRVVSINFDGITVVDDGYSQLRETIALQYLDDNGDKVWAPRRITSATSIPGGLVKFECTPFSTTLDKVVNATYFLLSRLGSDRVELNWVGNGVCEATTPVMSVVPLVQESDPSALPAPVLAFDWNSARWKDVARTELADIGDPVQSISNAGSLGGYFEFSEGVPPTSVNDDDMNKRSLHFSSAGILTYPHDSSLNITSAGFEVLVTLWTDDPGSLFSSDYGPVCKWDGSGDKEWVLVTASKNIPNQIAAQVGSARVEGVLGETVKNGNQHLLSFRVDEQLMLHLTLNGREVVAGSEPIPVLPTGSAPIALGSTDATDTVPINSRFEGKISALRIYDKQLTPSQRSAIMSAMTR